MAYSYNVYTGNGSTTQFTIGFSYIRREHVKVYVAYVDTAYTYVNSTTVQLATAPGAGVRVEVRRVTPVASVLVDFADGSTLVAADLDTSNLQHLYIEQELDDASKQAIYVDPATGQLTAGGQQIKNVANPTAAQDAATKSYVDTVALAALPDGDRGDITVSGTGTIWTVDSGLPASRSSFTQAGTGAAARTVDSKLKDVVSIKDFGAVGDGVANDRAAFQAALDTGKNVFIPDGVFLFNSSVSYAASGQTIYGSGNNSVLKSAAGSVYINTNGYNNVSIRNLKVDGTTGTNGGYVINSSSRNVSVDSVYFYQGGQRVWLFTCGTVRITNCTFEQTGYGIIQQTGNSSSDVLVANNTAINVGNDFVEANCASTPSFNWVISNNVYEGCSSWPTAATESRFVGITGVNGVVITGNTAKRVCGDAAVHLEDIGGEVIVSNNYFVDVLGTGYIYILNTAENSVITGNILEHRDASITPAPAVWCLNNYNPKIVFSGNRVKGIAAAKTFDAFAVGFFAGQLIIDGNIFDTLRDVFSGATAESVSLTNNKFVDCTNPLSKAGGTGSSFRDFLIANNVFSGTTGANDILAGSNVSGTGAPKRILVNGNKFCKQVAISGHPGGVVGSASDAEDITVTNNVFSAAATLAAPSGTMSRRNYSGNILESTGAYEINGTTVTGTTVTATTLNATNLGNFEGLIDYRPLKGRTHFSDYQGGVNLTGTNGQYSISDDAITQTPDTTSLLNIGNGFILPKAYSGTVSYSAGPITAGAFSLVFESSTDGITWTALQTWGNGTTGAKTYSFSSLTDATALRFRFQNSNGTPGNIGVNTLVIPGLTSAHIAQATGTGRVVLNQPHFPNVGTTATAANAFLDNAASPVNRLLRSTSSIRYKTEVEDLEVLRADAVLGLRPVWYRSLAEADPSEWSYYGLIAEEVAEVEPRLVTWTYPQDAYETAEETIEIEGEPLTREVTRLKPGATKIPDGVQYDRLPVLLLDVIKRQHIAIEELKIKVTTLESQANG